MTVKNARTNLQCKCNQKWLKCERNVERRLTRRRRRRTLEVTFKLANQRLHGTQVLDPNRQCDQTVWSVFQYLVICNNENLPNSIKIFQSWYKILPNIEWTLERLHKTFKFLPNRGKICQILSHCAIPSLPSTSSKNLFKMVIMQKKLAIFSWCSTVNKSQLSNRN